MTKKPARTHIPKKVSEGVLKEFNHRCAVCGSDRPQMHHIDEDRSNNRPENLLPLCPNCHLNDQHNPTAPPDQHKLALFRKYKDPAILHPKFYPLWIRCRYLLDINDISSRELSSRGVELTEFVRCLAMGSFYGQRVFDLVCSYPLPYGEKVNVVGLINAADRKRKEPITMGEAAGLVPTGPVWNAASQKAFRDAVIENRTSVFAMIVELLRFQDWTDAKPRHAAQDRG